ncbi:hypothetical protein BV898_02334 [Hypsibius exemplaris]|uniref:Apple domain-containing protein n=1 Tax=Hypsibius exemplaris TaxID=2072580 RepID=A0A1W0X9B2_HYPEX|nr:hypothetical protein BV898_02334 [Hypsibius exemplaris]
MLKVQLCINLILFCALVRPSQGKDKLCFSESYFGQCDGDDEACVQACKEDKLSGGKCGAYKIARVCYCEGCHQGVTDTQIFPTIEVGVDYPCGDLVRLDGVQTQEECWAKCDAPASGCVVATYGERTCWLKSRKNDRCQRANRVSYVKHTWSDRGGGCMFDKGSQRLFAIPREGLC